MQMNVNEIFGRSYFVKEETYFVSKHLVSVERRKQTEKCTNEV